MEFKPTLFSVAGFLVPGVVLAASLTYVVGLHQYGSVSALVAAVPVLPDGTAVVLGTLVVVSLLAGTFAIGAVLSDLYLCRPACRPATTHTGRPPEECRKALRTRDPLSR
jgi:hypothetical protein